MHHLKEKRKMLAHRKLDKTHPINYPQHGDYLPPTRGQPSPHSPGKQCFPCCYPPTKPNKKKQRKPLKTNEPKYQLPPTRG